MRPFQRRSSCVCRAQQGDSRWQMHEQGAAPASCGTCPLGPRAGLPLPGCLRGGTAGTVCPSSNQLCAPSQRPYQPAPPLRASVRAASATPCAPPPTRCTHCATLVPCAHLLWLERRTPAWPGCEAGAGKLAAPSSGSGSKGRKRYLAIAPGLLTAQHILAREENTRPAPRWARQRAAARGKQNGEPTATKGGRKVFNGEVSPPIWRHRRRSACCTTRMPVTTVQ